MYAALTPSALDCFGAIESSQHTEIASSAAASTFTMSRPRKLSIELATAAADDAQRAAVDAAKKRAVAQHADYDTFRKMVRRTAQHQ
jgi:Dynein attachment factor N-terminus